MSRVEKLIARLRSLPVEMEQSEVAVVLAHFGWTRRRTKGSHQVWGDNGQRLVLAAHGRRIKRPYLADILRLLKLEVNNEEQS